MKIVWPLLDKPLSWEDGGVQTLVIENKPALRSFLESARRQSDGDEGGLILSDADRLMEFSKAAELLTDPFSLPLTSRKLLTKLAAEARLVGEEWGNELSDILYSLNALAGKICAGMEYNVTYTELESIEEIFKLMRFYPDLENESLPERIMDYFLLSRGLLGKKLFICYGLHACMTEREMDGLCREAVYHKLCLLLVEAVQPKASPNESLLIIDHDLCII